ncbi:MAG: outer membrane beta-barrel protein [Gammaproteobacteria bacterium]|nr:outer membrane beta-barrel protein [Gammaproteobacteria bacterium]
MKRLLIACLLSLLAAQANAKESPFYMAIKAGMLDAGNSATDNAVNAAFDIGYRHNRYLSTEMEYSTTFINGNNSSGNDWSTDVLSVFAALRSNTKVKLKGKIGVSNIEGGNSGLELSTGIGIGFWAAGGLMEVEYTKLDDGLSFFSVGVNYFY